MMIYGCLNPTRGKGVDVQEWLAANDDFQIFPTIAREYPYYFLKTSLKGVAYDCNVSSTIAQIQPSNSLMSPREEKLKSRHGDESNVMRV